MKRNFLSENRKILVIVVVVILCVLGISFVAGYATRDNNSLNGEKQTEKNESLDLESISGYASEQISGIQLPDSLEETGLCIQSIGRYTGPFVEDGSDDPSVNLLSLIITNESDQMIEYAELVFKVNEDDDAVFKITSLPAGSSVLVQESNKKTFEDISCFALEQKMIAVNKDASLKNEILSISADQNTLHLKNRTKDSLGTVYVRYKNMLQDNLYMGGITYSCRFDDVGGNADVTQQTGHFIENYSVILDIVTESN